MLFYLTTLNLARFLNEDTQTLRVNIDAQVITTLDAWKHSDFLRRNYVLNFFMDTLHKVYSSMSTANELWEFLEKKYKIEDVRAKKFLIGQFLDYNGWFIHCYQSITRVPSNPTRDSFWENDCEWNFPSSCYYCKATTKLEKNYLTHKMKEKILEELIVRITIEKDNKS